MVSLFPEGMFIESNRLCLKFIAWTLFKLSCTHSWRNTASRKTRSKLKSLTYIFVVVLRIRLSHSTIAYLRDIFSIYEGREFLPLSSDIFWLSSKGGKDLVSLINFPPLWTTTIDLLHAYPSLRNLLGIRSKPPPHLFHRSKGIDKMKIKAIPGPMGTSRMGKEAERGHVTRTLQPRAFRSVIFLDGAPNFRNFGWKATRLRYI